ncbi:hypothetical protein GCM10027566_37760 [Arachidicoccus ginsenosidivorans]|uniref:Uncharacterized protein n=1 Tax=Arachidicoccus ginsenosidivorans TaxID=496057 RepID=A0A5B8VNR0_9BACT|nr:hypothetical protein [Arachidicoccus ginsenosidivorans]QEC72296.1 hypothetical protein FSB73_12045 [Arachidicoccus ginsenosidivorans]
MKQNIAIEINGQPVKHCVGIPKGLSKGVFPTADKITVSVPEVDILLQKVDISGRGFWEINFIAHKEVKICFKHPDGKLFILYNLGTDVLLEFGSLESQFFKTNQFNAITVPTFEMTAFPKASNRMYKLILLDIVGDVPDEKIDSLLNALM